MAFRRTTRPKRKLPPHKGYAPAGEPEGYSPPLRTRKAPNAYWRRNPYPPGYPAKATGTAQPYPEQDPGGLDYDELEFWDPTAPDFFGAYRRGRGSR